jgi:hypothetical protein
MPPELKTPPDRRLIATGTTGVFRRGDRFVAVTYRHGRRVKTTHDTKRDACAARAGRMRGAAPSRERFEDYAERWLVEYRGRTARGLTTSTRDAYAWTMRTWVIPYFRGTRIGDLRRADVKRFIDHLATAKPRQSQQGATRLAVSTIRRIVTPLKACSPRPTSSTCSPRTPAACASSAAAPRRPRPRRLAGNRSTPSCGSLIRATAC